MNVLVATLRTQCQWYARGYNDHRPLSGPVQPPYIAPEAFADWYIAECKDPFAPTVTISDAFTMFVTKVTEGITT